MDVANRIFKKTALFLVAVLGMVAPVWAQSTLAVSSFAVGLSGNQAQQISVTASAGGDTTYTVNNQASFVNITSANGFKTPDTLSFQIQNPNCLLFTNPCTGNVVLHPSNRPSTDTSGDATVTVTYSPSGGGSGGGPIVASPASLNLSAVPGQTTQQTVSLTASQNVSIQNISVNQACQSFLSTSISPSFNVGPSSPATLTVTASAFGLTANTYACSITITPVTGVQTVISVTFVVGGSGTGGSFTISPGSVALNYPTGPTSASVTISSTATASFNYSTTTSSQVNWLRFDNGTAGLTATSISHIISVDPSSALLLQNAGITSSTGTVTITNASNSADSANISVTLTLGSGSGGGGITLSQTLLQVSSPVNGSTQTSSVTVTPPSNTTPYSGTVSAVNGTSTLFVSLNSGQTFFTGAQNIAVTVNPSGLASGTYYNNVLFQQGSATGTLQVILTVGNGGGGGSSVTVGPTSLTFASLASIDPTVTIAPQLIGVGTSGAFTVGAPSASWLTVTPLVSAGPNASAIKVALNSNAAFLAAGTSTASFTVTPSSGSLVTVTVSLLVSAGPLLVPAPGSVNLPSATSSSSQAVSFFEIPSSTLITVNAVSQTSWVTVTPSTNSGINPFFTISANPTGLCNGINIGSVAFTSTGLANSPVTVPVVLLVSGSSSTNCSGGGGGALNLSNTSLQFTAPLNGQAPSAQFVTITSATGSIVNYGVAATTQNGGNWLSVTPSGSFCCFTSNTTGITVSVNQFGLANGTYTGTITLTPSTGGSQTINVTMVVGTGSSLTVNPTSLTYNFTPGGTAPQAQQISVTSPSGSSPISFTYQATSESNFLQANTGGGNLANGTTLTTPVTLNATIDPTVLASLSAGVTHTGTITLTPVGGGTAVTIPVSLIIAQAASVTASPTTMSFAFTAGGATPSTQPITVSGTSGATFSATATSVGNWLSVSPTTGTVPATLNVSVNPAGLNANTYTGTIVVAGTGSSTGSTTINVTLTVSAPLPTITQIGSAASYVGTGVAPGEWIAIQGNGLGPATGLTLTIDQSTGKVSTTLGGVQVFVNGFAAPIVYASNTLVNAVVPYEVAGGPGTVAQILVKFLGVSSNAVGIPVVSTLPGIFTQNASGAGPGWVRNSDFSPNSSAFPAKKGEIVSVILTGEGLTTPTAVTGKVTTVSSTPPPTPVPLLPVAVLVDGKPASPTFVGEAPSILSGVLQVNFQVPTNASSGPVSLVVSVGGVASQPNVIMFVQ